jgi:hypothetical protein
MGGVKRSSRDQINNSAADDQINNSAADMTAAQAADIKDSAYVVDAVARHGANVALALQRAHDRDLVRRLGCARENAGTQEKRDASELKSPEAAAEREMQARSLEGGASTSPSRSSSSTAHSEEARGA